MNTNTTICELILTNHSQTKINVDGYLMVKDKNRSNSYYWCCERRDTLKCNGRATTRLIDGQHYLRNTSDHNHAAEASRVSVIRTVNTLKERAGETNEPPVQIIQNVMLAALTKYIHTFLLSMHSVNQLNESGVPNFL